MPAHDDGSRPRGRDDTVHAVVEAATRLFSERDPASVSMREIAAEAGVTYGLLHRHFGTKQAVLAAVFRRQAVYGAEAVRAATDPLDALDTVTGLGVEPEMAARFARMLALVVLDGTPPEDFYERSEAFDAILRRVDEEGLPAASGSGSGPSDRRVVLVAALLIGLGWNFYGPFLQHALGLGDLDAAAVRHDLADLVESIAREHLT